MKKLLLVIAAAGVLSACGAPYNIRSISAPDRHVVDKSYTLGQEQVAYVGEPVVRIKDYRASPVPVFTSPVAVSATLAGSASVQYQAGAQVEAVSRIDYDGVTYFMARPSPPMPRDAMLLIDQDGRYQGMAYTHQDEVFEACEDEEYVCVTPASIKFSRSQIDRVNRVAPGFINFEIVYSGATKDTINLLYREYTPENMARAAFTQNLTYDRATSSIRFRDIQIRVVEAGNESLRYVVEADGLAPTEQ